MSSNASINTIEYDVYLGFWINWSHGRTQGATITLTRESGGLLIAFLALFVSTAGASFWRICCFACYSILSSKTPQDGLYHQRQAILRNTVSALRGLWDLLLIGFAWRKPGFPFRRIIPLAVLATVLASGFALSGIYSSRVTTDNANEVLLKGKNCGIFSIEPISENFSTAALAQYSAQRLTAYLDQSLQCYSTNGALQSENCRPYIKPRLPYTMTSNASCPFDPAICLIKDNLVLDTGLLNSHDHFGINAPPKGRFHFRHVVSCAPLVTEGFSKIYINSAPKIPLMRYYYGKDHVEEVATKIDTSFTYQVPVNFSMESLDNFTSQQSLVDDYRIGTKYTTPTRQEELWAFQPILQLNRTDAGLGLIFLSAAGVVFYNPTDDPWFSAHKNGSTLTEGSTGKATPLMNSDHPAGVLACTDQYQFCTSNSSECQPLDAFDFTYARPTSDLWPDADDQATIHWAKRALVLGLTASINDFFGQLGASALLARFSRANGVQFGSLPPDQWQKEVEHMFQGSLMSFQDAFVSAANGPFAAEIEANYIRPNTSSQTAMCKSQKIFSALYYSFNVLGLSIILVIGTVFLALDLSIVSIVSYVDKKRKHPCHTYSRLEWQAASTLQLQRMAHEEMGLGSWDRCTKSVPTTQHGELLGVLDLSDEAHPRLMRVDEVREKIETETAKDGHENVAVIVNECVGSEHRESTSSESLSSTESSSPAGNTGGEADSEEMVT